MAGNRKAATEFALSMLEATSNSRNRADWEKRFNSMSDKEFERLMRELTEGQTSLYVTMPSFTEEGSIDTRQLIKVGRQLGHEFFQKLWITTDEGQTYLSPVPYMVLDIPVRRVSQTLSKKMSVPDNSKVIDTLTGQPTGESKGAKISWPELHFTSAMGLDKSLVELEKYRGGDVRGYVALSGMLSKFGQVSIDSLAPYASGVESLKTLKTILTCCHIKNTL